MENQKGYQKVTLDSVKLSIWTSVFKWWIVQVVACLILNISKSGKTQSYEINTYFVNIINIY